MGRIRVVMFEAEGSGDTVLSAIAGFLGGGREEDGPGLKATALLAPPAVFDEPEPLKEHVRVSAGVSRAPRVKRAAGGKSAARKEASVGASGAATMSPIAGEVYEALAKGPMSSGALVRRFEGRCSAGSVYTVLTGLRSSKRVETRRDDADGETKNFRL